MPIDAVVVVFLCLTDDVNRYSRNVSNKMLSVSMILLSIIKCTHRLTKNRNENLITTIKKHGENTLATYKQYEKLKLKCCRVGQALAFLRTCLLYNVQPKFMRFKLYNNNLRKTAKYKDHARNMLLIQHKLLNILNSNISSAEFKLKNKCNIVLLTRIKYYLNELISREQNKRKDRHKRKLVSLNIPICDDEFNNKLVYNYSYRNLTDNEENLSSKGWKYAIRLHQVNILNVKTDLEYLFV